MSLRSIDANHAQRLLAEGAILVDIREAAERAREQIPGTSHLPLSKLDQGDLAGHQGKVVIFHCRSGARTRGNAPRLAGKAGACEAYILEGGIDAWRNAGLPVATDRGQPLELPRQILIGAGGVALIGMLLGLLVSPWFFAVPLFMVAAMIMAGGTGFCGMARILMRAP